MAADKKAVDYYNQRWSSLRFVELKDAALAAAILEHVSAQSIRHPRICDLGCGAGWMSAVLSSFGPVTAVDMSDEGVAAARERYPSVHEFVCADAIAWQPGLAEFDIVVSQEVLEHIEDQAAYLANAYRLLRSGGRLILTTPNADTVLAMPEDQRSHQPIENWRTRAELLALLENVGFRSIQITSLALGYGHTGAYRVVNSEKLLAVLKAVGLYRWFRRRASDAGFGLHHVAVASKR